MNTHQQLPSAAAASTSFHPQLVYLERLFAAAKHPQSARAVIPAGRLWLSWNPRLLNRGRQIGCLMAVVGWVLGVGWSAVPAMAAVKLTELYPAPASGESEWAELYNDSPTEAVNLTGWWLQDQVSSPSVISTLTDLVLPPDSYLKVVWTASKLNNSGDAVILYDQANQPIDLASFSSSTLGMSWARIGSNEAGYSWVQQSPSPGLANAEPSPSPSVSPSPSPMPSPSPSPTPTVAPSPSPSATSTPSPSPTGPPIATGDLKITTIMACPSDSQPEWLEIYNNSDHTVSVTGWYVTDAANNRRNLTDTIDAYDFTTIQFTSSFINNTGETLWLYSPNNQVNQTINLPSCEEKGIALVLSGTSWIAENELNQNSGTTNISPTNTSAITTSSPKPSSTYTNTYLPSNATSTYSDFSLPTTLNPITTEESLTAGTSAQLKELFQQQTFHLDVPFEATNLFKKPVKLFTTARTTTANGAWELIIGGSLITLSLASQLIQKMMKEVL